jgi:hypothetical protein
MDTMGDADLLADDEEPPPRADRMFTAEALALAGAGLVLMSVFATGVFQYATYLLFSNNEGGGMGRTTQYLLLAGPCAVLAAAGAVLGWSTRGRTLTPGLRGVAGAAVIVGTTIALLILGTAVVGDVWGNDSTDF